ncbi:MAG: 50S ribosomal protein L19, partial [Candidatus Moranbacteria bacterium]|nr:50S ribosomal protein L19 [Candidatus Moranbacteria bacterium]
TGVEITVPLHSPVISKIEIVKQAKVRQAKLYYLRGKGIRISKLKTKELDKFVVEEEKEEPKIEVGVEQPAKGKTAGNTENKE